MKSITLVLSVDKKSKNSLLSRSVLKSDYYK